MKLISGAIVALQADLKPVKKNSTNPFFKSSYADLASIMQMIQPLLEKHKLAILQPTTNIDGQSAIKTIILHESGEAITSEPMPLIMPKTTPQDQGSAITYARRYSLCSALGIVADNDDDGQRATESMNKPNSSQLAIKKAKLFSEFGKAKITIFGEQQAYIENILGKTTIDTVEEADIVLKALESDHE